MGTMETKEPPAARPLSPQSPIADGLGGQHAAAVEVRETQVPATAQPSSPRSPTLRELGEQRCMELLTIGTGKRQGAELENNWNPLKKLKESDVADAKRPLSPRSPVRGNLISGVVPPAPQSPQSPVPVLEPQPTPMTQANQVPLPPESQPAQKEEISLFTKYRKVRSNLRRAMKTKKYGRLPYILKLFTDSGATPEPDTFDVLADCLARSGQDEKAREFREKARALRSDGDIISDPVEQLANIIRNGEDDCDIITSSDISSPNYSSPQVTEDVLVSKVQITLDTVSDVFIEGISEIVAPGTEPCENDALREEVERKEQRAKRKAAAAAIDELHRLVQMAKESRADTSDADMDVDTPSATQRLYDLISNPTDTYQLILSREISQPRYLETPNTRPGFIEVELQVRLDVQKDVKDLYCDIEDRVTVVEGMEVVARRSAVARDRKVKKLRDAVAAKALEELDDITKEVRLKASDRLDADLNHLLNFWRNLNKQAQYEKSLERLEKIVLDVSWAGLYGCKIQTFGSVPCGLALPHSDLDVNIALPKLKNHKTGEMKDDLSSDPNGIRNTCRNVLNYLMQFFHRFKMAELNCIDSAKVPVLRYKDPETQLDVDVTVSNDDGILLTKMLRAHVKYDHRIWELVMVVKYWAKTRGISGVPLGFINPLGWTVMVIHFLQHCVTPSIAPLYHVRNMESKHVARDVIVKKAKWNSSCKRGKNKSQIAELLVEFFHFYAYKFDFANDIISLSSQEPKSRESVGDSCDIGLREPAICIEQPLRPGANIVGYVTAELLQVTKSELKRGYFGARNVGKGDEFLFVKAEALQPFMAAMGE